MKKIVYFYNSSLNIYIWKTNRKVVCASLYQDYYLGCAEYTKNFLRIHIDIAAQTYLGLGYIKKIKAANSLYAQFFYSFNFFFFKKFKFIGKGYKIKKVKIKKSFKLFFGYSHKVFLVSGGVQLRKLMKYKLFLITNNKLKIRTTSYIIQNIRKLNMFTKRGLRATRQQVSKRPGKKSTY
jgi:hypothetical protein